MSIFGVAFLLTKIIRTEVSECTFGFAYYKVQSLFIRSAEIKKSTFRNFIFFPNMEKIGSADL